MTLYAIDFERVAGRAGQDIGHKHFWERAFSRRAFLAGGAVGVGGAALYSAGFSLPGLASSPPGAPTPIPGSVDVAGTHFHVNLPGPGDQSTVFDFNGLIAATDTSGVGAGTFGDLTFDADMRVMIGEYVDLAGRHQNAAFGFI